MRVRVWAHIGHASKIKRKYTLVPSCRRVENVIRNGAGGIRTPFDNTQIRSFQSIFPLSRNTLIVNLKMIPLSASGHACVGRSVPTPLVPAC